jgi:hypothetical protein
MNKFISLATFFLFVILPQELSAQNIQAEKSEPSQVQKTTTGKNRVENFALEMQKVLSLNEDEYRGVLKISNDAANKVESEKRKKQNKEMSDNAIRQIRNEKLLQLESLLGKEKMRIWKKHQKSKRPARNSQIELIED